MSVLLPYQRIYRGNKAIGGIAKTEKVWPPVHPPWQPSDIAGLNVWLDASQLGLADGAAVTPWPDLSGKGHSGNIVGTPAPKLRANVLSGKPVVRFTANEGRVRGDNGLVGAPGIYNATIVYVSRVVGPSVGRVYTATFPPTNYLVGYHSSAYDCMYDGSSWLKNDVAYPALPTPWKMYGSDASHDGTNYLSRFFINGVVSGSVTGGGGAGSTYNLSGYDPGGTQETCDCEIAEVLLYDHKLTDAERQQIEGYLQAKWLV